MGLLDRLDALDRRLGLKRPAPRWDQRLRRPWTVIALFVPLWIEFQGLVATLVRQYPSGVPAVLAVLGLVTAVMAVFLLAATPRPWALRTLLLLQGVLTVRVLYRGLVDGPAARLAWLGVVAAFVALLLAPPTRRFFAGEWKAERRS